MTHGPRSGPRTRGCTRRGCTVAGSARPDAPRHRREVRAPGRRRAGGRAGRDRKPRSAVRWGRWRKAARARAEIGLPGVRGLHLPPGAQPLRRKRGCERSGGCEGTQAGPLACTVKDPFERVSGDCSHMCRCPEARTLRVRCRAREAIAGPDQSLIRPGSQVMIPGKIMQRVRPSIMRKTNGVVDL